MAVTADDLVAYGSATMPDDDSVTDIGGAIDTSIRVSFTDVAPADTVDVVSDDSGDSQDVTIHGRDDQGVLVSETLTLNGTTTVNGAQTFDIILKVVVSASHAGNITLTEATGGDTLMVIEPGVLEVRRPFYDALAEDSDGVERTYYEKFFIKNNNGSTALTSASIAESADPSGKVAFDLEGTLNGSDTNGGGDRQTAPSGYTFDSTTKSVAGGDLTATDAQGVWAELTLPAGEAPQQTSFTLTTSGNTT
ncbi:hypothetical protein [Thiohalorhabdus sp.]|uniref:hypothetical protein n=1 Tax=Thiohalorhabdus sp. TaxID=3094134 RepID=UPI002FC28A9C